VSSREETSEMNPEQIKAEIRRINQRILQPNAGGCCGSTERSEPEHPTNSCCESEEASEKKNE
jgi:methionine synthase I (cobalamin-dependent)